MNVEKRADGWYASLTVPPDVREAVGKSKFLKKLVTTSDANGRATQEAAPIVKGWKREIKRLRATFKGTDKPYTKLEMALIYKELLSQADHGDPENGDHGDYSPTSEALDKFIESVKKTDGVKVSSDLNHIAHGLKIPLEPHYNQWAESKLKGFSLKTADSYKRDAKIFVDEFVVLEAIDRKAIKRWIARLMEHGIDPKKPKPMSITTLRDRFICGVRSFYNYLDDLGIVDDEKGNPFEGVIPKEDKTKINLTKKKGWIPFEPKEVAQLYQSIPEKDIQLPTVMAIGMFTGMRIEEICSLTVGQIVDDEGVKSFDILDSKTVAGIRKVPIHSQLLPLIDRLLMDAKGNQKEAPKDAFLIPDLGLNKYGDRSNAVGKRFGRLKTSLGFPSKKVYHSIRKCVVTQLDRAGFRETAIADVVGHDNPNMTMGRYSAGSDAKTKQEMVEAIKYPNLVL